MGTVGCLVSPRKMAEIARKTTNQKNALQSPLNVDEPHTAVQRTNTALHHLCPALYLAKDRRTRKDWRAITQQ